MAEENQMTEENKKTIIAFIAGLLVGGLLVFLFWNPSDTNVVPDDQNDANDEEVVEDIDDNEDDEDTTPVAPDEEDDAPSEDNDGEGDVTVNDQDAGSTVAFSRADFPTNEGWVVVRDYEDGQLGGILGAARWNTLTALLPSSVKLLRPTVAGNTYAVVFYTENGDRSFNLATDAQMGGVMETFEAE